MKPERYEDKIGAIPFPVTQLTESSVSNDPPSTTAIVPTEEPKVPTDIPTEVPTGLELTQQPTEELSPTATWEERLQHWHLTLCEHIFSLPPEFSHGGIQHVLHSAPVHKTVQDAFVERWVYMVFPICSDQPVEFFSSLLTVGASPYIVEDTMQS